MFEVPEGWRPFTDAELRRSSRQYGLRVQSGIVSETPPRRTQVVVLSTIGMLTRDWVWPPNGWPGHHPELRPTGAPEPVTMGGEAAVLSRFASDERGVWDEEGFWSPGEGTDREPITIVDVTAEHRGWLYKVVLSGPTDVYQEQEQSALRAVLDSWLWDVAPEPDLDRPTFSDE